MAVTSERKGIQTIYLKLKAKYFIRQIAHRTGELLHTNNHHFYVQLKLFKAQ